MRSLCLLSGRVFINEWLLCKEMFTIKHSCLCEQLKHEAKFSSFVTRMFSLRIDRCVILLNIAQGWLGTHLSIYASLSCILVNLIVVCATKCLAFCFWLFGIVKRWRHSERWNHESCQIPVGHSPALLGWNAISMAYFEPLFDFEFFTRFSEG